MTTIEELEWRFQEIKEKAKANNITNIDKEISRLSIALEDLKNNSCGCGEVMRIKVVEDMVKKLERSFTI